MARTVSLPEGCMGLSMDDGTRYDADRNGRALVSDAHARDISRSWAGGAGLVTPANRTHLATRATRWCTMCAPARAWQAWSVTCPRCGAATTSERPRP